MEKGEGRTPYHHFSAFLAAGIFISQLVWEMGIVLRSHALDYFLLTALFTGSGLFLGAVFHPLAYLSIKKQDSLRRRAIFLHRLKWVPDRRRVLCRERAIVPCF